MCVPKWIISIRLALALLIAVALTSVGLGHRFTQPQLDADLLSYVAAGGSLSDLCGTPGDPDSTAPANCDACNLVSTAMIGPAFGLIAQAAVEQILKHQFSARVLPSSITFSRPPARGPPAVV